MQLYNYKVTIPPYERKGAYVEGSAGIGELAPHPVTHRESLEEALAALALGDRSLPSVAFALDMANTKIDGPKAASYRLITDADPLPTEPCPVKLKIGRDFSRLRELQALGCSVRLDANRAWTLEEALSFDLGPIEYIEEPLKNPSQLSLLHREKGWPLALDETLYLNEPWEKIEGVTTLILKPAALGPLERTFKLASLGYRAVISSCFESPAGIEFLAKLAYQLAPDELCGLDTEKYFSRLACGQCYTQ